jgi:hypothetical protein
LILAYSGLSLSLVNSGLSLILVNSWFGLVLVKTVFSFILVMSGLSLEGNLSVLFSSHMFFFSFILFLFCLSYNTVSEHYYDV